MAISHNLGFPRIGSRRQLKFALEAYWSGKASAADLERVAADVRTEARELQSGLDLLPVGDFSFYDHVLDTSALLGVVPERFGQSPDEPVSLDTYFRVARGRAPSGEDAVAGEMTKWFDTNYHFIVPEVSRDQHFRIAGDGLFAAVAGARAAGVNAKAVLLGPVTWLWLAKARGEPFDRLELLPALLDAYAGILARLDTAWVQIDEPILVLDLEPEWQEAVRTAYEWLGGIAVAPPALGSVESAPAPSGGPDATGLATSYPTRPRLLLTTYFGPLADNLELVAGLPVDGLHVDAVLGDDLTAVATAWPAERVLSVGIVNGRNVWANDLRASLERLRPLAARYGNNLWLAPSCSLLHVPVDLESEDGLDAEFRSWLAFAAQKVREVVTLTRALNEGDAAVADALAASDAVVASRAASQRIHDAAVKARVAGIAVGDDRRAAPYAERAVQQRARLRLPLLPTTTIGSFPQTREIRALRRDLRAGVIDQAAYEAGIREQIVLAVAEQERLGLDVLVHGEAERNDMVEYFGELLSGFAFTRFGWVQSYGSRCVKPPVIYGDVSRPAPMTVEWIRYAQRLTKKPVKGMLTGPVTILSWSFPREDVSAVEIAYQIGLALRDEVADLEAAGVAIIQIDEPAFRELLPLRRADQPAYTEWAERAFRLSSSGVRDETQIHTHMCYSEFSEIIASIASLDADVITVETSRSHMEFLDVFRDFRYPNEIGPGVYDIHSPRVPTVGEIVNLLEAAAERLPLERLWVNPDCGLKTRAWPETRAALRNMVEAAQLLRERAGDSRGVSAV